jgi:glucosamine--fructose-6-phosphate aminotransferase (isomerizing)
VTGFREAILAQPDNLRAGHDAARAALDDTDLAPLRSGTLVVAAIGASLHAAIPFVQALRAAGRRAFLLAAEDVTGPAAAGLGDAFVLVSQSGRSSETLATVQALGDAPTLAVTAHPDSPLAAAAGGRLPLGPAPDTPVATLSYTATLQTLGLLADALTGAHDDDWRGLPELAAAVLEDCTGPIEAVAEGFSEVVHVDAVGGGSGRASAGETALLAREGLGLPATGMGTREYLHGPMESAATGLGAIVFGAEREARLAADLRSFGAEVVLVGERGVAGGDPGGLTIPPARALARPILEILPVQLLAERVARRRGLPIGELRRSQGDTKVTA